MEFIDLKAQYKVLQNEINAEIKEVLNDAQFIIGPKVKQLEHELAKYVGRKHCITCSDGTAALQLIYMAYGIGVGDAVFCPDMTFFASIEPACLLGATPVFCDIDPISYNISPLSLRNQIEAVLAEGKLKPKAIVVVDFVGNPADYKNITEIAKEYNLILIEDAAQGMGASLNGQKCCSFGEVSATSFFPSKPLGCYGDGGAVFTDDDEIAEIVSSLRVHGRGVDKYHNVRLGINSRLDTIQAAILLPKLRVLDKEIELRQKVAERYNSGLSEKFIVPHISNCCISSYAQYVVMFRESGRREEILEYLKEKGIPSLLYYPVPQHLLPVFEGKINNYCEDFRNTVTYSNEHFGIPFSPYISEYEQDEVIHVLNNIN